MFPRLGGGGSRGDGLQTLLRPGLVTRHLPSLDRMTPTDTHKRVIELLKHQLHSQENSPNRGACVKHLSLCAVVPISLGKCNPGLRSLNLITCLRVSADNSRA